MGKQPILFGGFFFFDSLKSDFIKPLKWFGDLMGLEVIYICLLACLLLLLRFDFDFSFHAKFKPTAQYYSESLIFNIKIYGSERNKKP